jgi:hypothetical protein
MKSRRINQKFGLIVGGACLLLTAWRHFAHHQLMIWLLATGVLLILGAVIVPQILNPLRLLWDRVGHVLGIVNTSIILFLLYFLVITPIGLIMRLLGKNNLDLKLNPGVSTYWKPVKQAEQSSMKQQF